MGTKPDTAMIKNLMLQQKIIRLQRQVLEEHGFDTRPQHVEDSVHCDPEECFGCIFWIDSDENLNWDHIKIESVESFSHNITGLWGVDYTLTFRQSNHSGHPRFETASRKALEAKQELEEAWEILNKLEQIVEDEIDSALKADANLFRNWDFTEGWE